jgi:hypothetical protein
LSWKSHLKKKYPKENHDEDEHRVTRRIFGPKLQAVTGIWRKLRDGNLKIVDRTVIPFMNGESEPEIDLITKG